MRVPGAPELECEVRMQSSLEDFGFGAAAGGGDDTPEDYHWEPGPSRAPTSDTDRVRARMSAGPDDPVVADDRTAGYAMAMDEVIADN